jgi:hypothetical protein
VSVSALPQFVIVGAQKGGTTSLYSYLASHPSVMRAARKEIHYFDFKYKLGEEFYRSHFPTEQKLAERGAITGEATPYYLYHPHAARRISELLPNVKLIACLRNPVNRAISHYWHGVRVGWETLPMAEAFRSEAERVGPDKQRMIEDEEFTSHVVTSQSYADRGIYVDQLVRLEQHCPAANLLVLKSEDLFQTPQQAFDRVLDFLGLSPWDISHLPRKNEGSYRSPTSDALLAELTSFFEPHNQRLYEHLGVETPWW